LSYESEHPVQKALGLHPALFERFLSVTGKNIVTPFYTQ